MRGKAAAGFDLQVLMAAPEEARRLIIEKRQSESATSEPCAWLDQESRRCRYYDFRPEACRSFEPGSEPCVMVRKYKFG